MFYFNLSIVDSKGDDEEQQFDSYIRPDEIEWNEQGMFLAEQFRFLKEKNI